MPVSRKIKKNGLYVHSTPPKGIQCEKFKMIYISFRRALELLKEISIMRSIKIRHLQ